VRQEQVQVSEDRCPKTRYAVDTPRVTLNIELPGYSTRTLTKIACSDGDTLYLLGIEIKPIGPDSDMVTLTICGNNIGL